MESRLTFIRHDHFKEYKTKKGYITKIPYNLYQCECGKTKVIRREHVKRGFTKSCGCLNRELSSQRMHSGLNLIQYRISGGNEGNVNGGGGKKGQKAHNKGKIYLKNNPPGEKYVTEERLDAIFLGLEGEIHSLRIADEWLDFDPKFVKPQHLPVVELLKKGWEVRAIAKHLNMGESTLYKLTHIWKNGGRVKWNL